MRTYSEWLTKREEHEGCDETDGVKLTKEQASMMVKKILGLLSGLSEEDRSAIIDNSIKELRSSV